MTIPDDVRAIIHLALIEYNRHTAMGVGVALAWLDAQPAAPTERWEPVEEMPYTDTGMTPDGVLGICYVGEIVGIAQGRDFLASPLPDGYALCRRVEVTP